MRHQIVALVGLASLCGCAHALSSPQDPLATARCSELSATDREFAHSVALPRVDRIEPYKRRDMRTRATQQLTYTAGARLYVPAQQGWSAPYLERVLSCHAAASDATHANDPFQVAGVSSITVGARGSRYVITIAAQTREAGRQIWQRAEALHDQNARIEVRQLSQDATKPAL